MSNSDWDSYFLNLVHLLATRSKDQNTHIGAVVVNRDNIVKATGYNSFPRGIRDDVPERQQTEKKYAFFEHAERNAIYSAAREGIALRGCRIYISTMPCSDCARAIIQAGITEIIIDAGWEKHLRKTNKWQHWADSFANATLMLEEADILMRAIDVELLPIQRFCSKERF